MAKILNAVFIAVLLYCIKSAAASVCINDDPCLCEIDEHSKIDLSQATQKLQKSYVEDEGPNGNRFYFYGCKDGDFNATAHKYNASTPIIQGSLIHANSTYADVMGTSKQIKFSAIEGEKGHYQIVYKQGENVTARVRLVCVDFNDVFVKMISSDTNGTNPYLAFSSRDVCIITHHSGLSTGSVLLIIFFVCIGIYFIGGGLILYCMRGARGLEVIPNIDFWRGLPGLVKDGIIFLFSGCNASSITTPETYDRI